MVSTEKAAIVEIDASSFFAQEEHDYDVAPDHDFQQKTEHSEAEVEEQFVFIQNVDMSLVESGSLSEFSTKKYSDPQKNELIENLMKSDK